MLTMYPAPGSSSMGEHIALHGIGVPFERRVLSSARKETLSPDYPALNPDGQVPLLLVEGRPLTEAAGIMFHLARRHPTAGLRPKAMSSPRRRPSGQDRMMLAPPHYLCTW